MIVMYRRIFVQPGCGKFSLFRAFRKHRLIEDAVRSIIQCIIWCTHEDKTVCARGIAEVYHEFGFGGKFICSCFRRNENISATSKNSEMVY